MCGIRRSKSSRILTRSCNKSSQSHETFKEFRERKFIIKCVFMEVKMWLKHFRDQMSSPCWNSVGSKGLRRTSQGKDAASYNSSYTWKKERSASLDWVVAMLLYVLTLRCWTSRPRIFSWPSPGQRRYPRGAQSRSAPRWHSRYIHLGNNLKSWGKCVCH